MGLNITVIVTTYNSPGTLRLCMSSLRDQTLNPSAVLVADDGSGPETEAVVREAASLTDVPVRHIWHPDEGDRRSTIHNRAIAAASEGAYIVQIDGDVLLDRHFIEDHAAVASENQFVRGCRLLLSAEATAKLLSAGSHKVPFWVRLACDPGNALRCAPLRDYFLRRYAQDDVMHLRGCNMAYWREDAIKVNGFDEALMGWGHEDGEFALRLHNAGVRHASLKFGGLVFHLHHKSASKQNEGAHFAQIERTQNERLTRCAKGVVQYL